MRKEVVSLLAGALSALVLIGQQAFPARAQDAAPAVATNGAAAAQPVSMALPLKAGDVIRYRSTIKADFDGNDILVERGRKDTVKEVKGNGDVVVESMDEGGTVTAGGNANDIPAGGLTTLTMNKANMLLSFEPGEENPYLSKSSLHLMSLIDRIVLPDHPIKPGDSWTTEVDNPQVKGKKVALKTTFVGEEKKDGQSVWRVKQTLTADTELAGNKLEALTTALLDATTGQLIEAEESVKGLPTMNGTMDYGSTLKRVKADDKTGAGKEKAAEPKPAAP